MAVLTEERREVAARLRELADENTVTATDYLVREIFKELGGEPPAPPSNPTLGDLEAYGQAFLYRLADLIEPQERTCEVEGSYYDDLMEDHYTDLSCGHHVRGAAREFDFCPSCGARVIGG